MSESKTQKTKPKWWTAYWVCILVFAVIGAIVRFIVTSNILDKALLYTIIGFTLIGIAYYVRVKTPPMAVIKLIYRGMLGFVLGGVLWMCLFLTRFGWYLVNVVGLDEFTVAVGTLFVCLIIGVILGDLIGRHRNYKTAEQYSP